MPQLQINNDLGYRLKVGCRLENAKQTPINFISIETDFFYLYELYKK